MKRLPYRSTIALVLFSFALCASARASCPEVEGRYDYACTLEKDPDAELAKALEVAGTMLVQQHGCDIYTFYNDHLQIAAQVVLNDPNGKIQGKIRKSTADVLKFKTTKRVSGTKRWIQVGTLRKKRDGFTFEGKERSRVLGLFVKRHSKFDCRFKLAE
jgi:hypothetical protein